MPIVERLATVPGTPRLPGFSQAVVTSGRLAFVAGQVGLDADGNLVGEGDLGAQARQALRNMHLILRSLGADWPDIVRFNWYLLDASSAQAARDARDEIIRPSMGDLPNPASTLVQVAALIRPELLVEVEAVVALPD